MRHRVFIAINLPENIKKELSFYQEKWPELPTRWTRKENLHITLIFLGYVNDEELFKICKITRELVQKTPPFSLNLNKISYGPSQKQPRMIWVAGQKSKELAELREDLEEALGGKISGFMEENRDYSPHITLGRLKQWEFKRIELEERPEVSEEISLSFWVESVEVMESRLRPGGPDYLILQSAALGKNSSFV